MAPTGAFAAEGFVWNAFAGELILAKQSDGNSGTLQIDWAPRYGFSDRWYLRGNLGLTFFKRNTGTNFFAIDTQILAGFNIAAQWATELGGGLQTWVAHGGIAPALSANVVYLLSQKWTIVDRIVGGYTLFLLSGATTHQFKLGVGAAF